MKKSKLAAVAAPQNAAEADKMLHRLGTLQNTLARLEANQSEAVSKVKATYAGFAEPAQTEAAEILAGLSAWAAANRAALTDGGKTKQVKLPSGIVGWRTAPPSIAFKRGFKAEQIVEMLKLGGARMKRFIRITESVNKEAMLDDPVNAAVVPGVIVKSGVEAFYAEPAGAELTEPKK